MPLASELQDVSCTSTAMSTVRCMKFSYAYKPFSPLYNTITLSTVEVTHVITSVSAKKSLTVLSDRSCQWRHTYYYCVFNKDRNMLPAVVWQKFICHHTSNSTRGFSYMWCWLLHKSQLTKKLPTDHCKRWSTFTTVYYKNCYKWLWIHDSQQN